METGQRHRKWLTAYIAVLSFGLLGAGGERIAPDIHSQTWINSEPLSIQELRGQVVLVEFWTFGCWNCKNIEPYVKKWHRKYADKGLVVIGVHTPEFEFERKLTNLRSYIEKSEIEYPVVVDNDASIWRSYQNWAWPTIYLVGKRGSIRYKRIGEGGYETTEITIRKLLSEE